MPVYSFGEESPLKFHISDKLASRYNEAVKEFFKAQVRFNQKWGRKWDPVNDPILIKWSRQQKKAWADFAKIFDKVNAQQGPFHANDIMDDFLVKSVSDVSDVSGAVGVWGRYISDAAALGALYGFLRGLYSA